MPELNHYARIVENAWLLDYQHVENSLRVRVVERAAGETFIEVKDTLLDLRLPVLSSDITKGEIIAQGIAPAPLSQNEWERVVESENPRLLRLSKGSLRLSNDPSNYIITLKVTVRGNRDKSFVILDYILSSPRYAAIGFQVPRVAPPQAVAIGSQKFWAALTERLVKASKPLPREKRPDELDAFLAKPVTPS